MKALVHLVKHQGDGVVQISHISEKENIPRKFLESILLDLRKAGYLGSQKGKSGGYYLLKSPDQISIAEVYRHLEGPIAPVPCVSLHFYEKCEDCVDEGHCEIHLLMIKVRDSALSIYTKTTLADLLK